MKKETEFSCRFGHNIISNILSQAIRNNIGHNISHKNITKLVFLWPNMSQIGVIRKEYIQFQIAAL